MNYIEKREKRIKAVINEKEITETNIKKLKNFYSEASNGLLNSEFKEDFDSKTVFELKYDLIVLSFLIKKEDNQFVGYLNFYDFKYDFNVKYKLEEKNEKEIEMVAKEWKEKFPTINVNHVIEDLDKLVTIDTSELKINSFYGVFNTEEEF